MKLRIFAILALSLLSVALYLNSLGNSFHFDDLPNIVENPYIKNLNDLPSLLRGIQSLTGPFRALPTLSFAVNYRLHKLNVLGYHLVNLILHILSGILVFLISRKLFAFELRQKGSPLGDSSDPLESKITLLSFFSAAIFLFHPIQVNTVTYIIGRNEGMAGFFYLLSFFLFIRASLGEGRQRRLLLFLGAGLSGLFSIFSKEIGLTLPIVLILFDLIFICTGREDYIKRLKIYVPVSFCLGLYILFFLRGGILRLLISSKEMQWSPWEHLLTQANVILQYFKLLLLPLPRWLSVDHDFAASKSLWQYPTFISVSVLLFLLIFAAVRIRKNRLISLSIFWFFVILAPTSSILPTWDLMVEYRLYLPIFSYALLLTLGLYYLHALLSRYISIKLSQAFLLGLSILILGFYSLTTVERNRVFKNALSLWTDAAKKSPNKMRVHHNLARAYFFQKGRLDDAIREGEIALKLSADLYKKQNVKYVLNLLGGAYSVKGETEKAIASLQRAIEIDPNYATSYYNLSCIHAIQKDKTQALEYLKKAISLDPKYKEKARMDKDFASLRGEKEFEEIIQ